ncbi:uncharacterized protein [Diadema antillarum]|uniref:uncharacterized protein n=1 Tax=Diadema antillarum TaxID=105358 RepID=UPI003A881FA9
MDRTYDLVLLLTLASSAFCGSGASVVGTAPDVQGWRGEDILLKCDIQEEPIIVYWSKETGSDQQARTVKARFVEGNFESVEERFDIDKNFSLVISDLEVADEGRYYCDVTLANLQDFGNSTLLTVYLQTGSV